MLDERGPQLADVARAVLEPGGLPAVIGCAAGKDRTGVAVALLLAAVGVPADEIVADYVLTGPAFSDPDSGRSAPGRLAGRADHRSSVHRPTWRRCSRTSRPTMVAPAALLRRHGLAPAELDLLVERLTEPATG